MPFCRMLSSLKSLGVASETACQRDVYTLVSYGAGYHAYCLSAGCFVRNGVDFVTTWKELL